MHTVAPRRDADVDHPPCGVARVSVLRQPANRAFRRDREADAFIRYADTGRSVTAQKQDKTVTLHRGGCVVDPAVQIDLALNEPTTDNDITGMVTQVATLAKRTQASGAPH